MKRIDILKKILKKYDPIKMLVLLIPYLLLAFLFWLLQYVEVALKMLLDKMFFILMYLDKLQQRTTPKDIE